ncbi:hypothetical protein K474DRAFT_1664991 [Panus rudis PR-1116 ss-1]|nr:hypothetical protein K474DRAFT_1664991 [Panus rudis PR-1116 ss-1]
MASFFSKLGKHREQTLSTDGLYAYLLVRYGKRKSFHWAIAIPQDKSTVTRMDAVNKLVPPGKEIWVNQQIDETLREQPRANVFVKIGTVQSAQRENLKRLLAGIPLESPPEDATEPFICKVWVRHAIRLMHANGYINCPDLNALEAEIQNYGDRNEEKVLQGGSWKVHASARSK